MCFGAFLLPYKFWHIKEGDQSPICQMPFHICMPYIDVLWWGLSHQMFSSNVFRGNHMQYAWEKWLSVKIWFCPGLAVPDLTYQQWKYNSLKARPLPCASRLLPQISSGIVWTLEAPLQAGNLKGKGGGGCRESFRVEGGRREGGQG